jgi:flavin-dependent dehydrogenase
MAVAPGGYVGLVRTRSGQGNLAAAIDASALRAARTPETAVVQILSTARLDVPDLASGERWYGTLPLTRQANRLWAERIVLVGDAAGYVEPFTGEGIGWAIASAISAVRPVVENLELWQPHSIARWEAAERRRMARGQLVCRLVSSFLRRPRAVRVALAALSVAPGLAAPLVRHVCRSKRNVQFSVS